jgi:lysozyme family protein
MTSTSQTDVIAAMHVLAVRRSNTADADEQVVIDGAIDRLAGGVQQLRQAAPLDAGCIVAQAADELEKVVGAARMAPFDHYLVDISSMLDRLQNALDALHAPDRLPAVGRVECDAPALAPAVAGAASGQQAPINSTRYAELKEEYDSFFQQCAARAQYQPHLDFYTARLRKFQGVYQDLCNQLGNDMPWPFVGILHAMEGGFNFTTHLHNGDPLTRRTVQVPQNRPVSGQPPFTWRDSARDALQMKGYDKVSDWSVPHMLYLWEKYNGMGYRPRRVPSPYLWSFSTVYSSGKYVADGKFDTGAVSRQCGAALMLKALVERGGWRIPAQVR